MNAYDRPGRHAELGVNLGGAVAQYLVATWGARTEPAA